MIFQFFGFIISQKNRIASLERKPARGNRENHTDGFSYFRRERASTILICVTRFCFLHFLHLLMNGGRFWGNLEKVGSESGQSKDIFNKMSDDILNRISNDMRNSFSKRLLVGLTFLTLITYPKRQGRISGCLKAAC